MGDSELSSCYKRLQELCHAFNYHEKIETISERLKEFLPKAETLEAYRAVTLREEVEFHPQGLLTPHVFTQFNWEKIQEPNQSWSRSLDGIKRFYSTKQKSNYYIIVVKGQIVGFSFIQLAENYAQHVNLVLENNVDSKSKYLGKTKELLEKLNANIEFYRNEEEIIAIEVKSWEFFEQFTY